jgi:hypothetical protein
MAVASSGKMSDSLLRKSALKFGRWRPNWATESVTAWELRPVQPETAYDALVLSDAVGSYFPEFQRVALEMIKAQGGIFGWVSDSERFLQALASATATAPAAGVAVG